MKVLLDTHTFLWGITAPAKLSPRVRLLLPAAQTWLSVVSIWEILTKVQIGKLSLPRPVGPFLTAQMTLNGVRVLPVTLDHTLRLEHLDLHHRDPFDRVLVAQSLEENLPLVTSDPVLHKYPVHIIW